MPREIPEENTGLWFNVFTHLVDGGCPPQEARECADIVATDEPGKPNFGRSEADQELIRRSLPYLQKDNQS